MEFVTATYRLRCAETEAALLARHIALEQTVEVPEELIDCPRIREQIVGRVRSVVPDAARSDYHYATIDYPAEVAGQHVGQMWNLLYGNISLKRCVRLVQVDLPPGVREQFRGPKYGITGLRERLGVFGRPLLATALKPRGSSADQLAALASEFALGGGEFVKDDHNLVDASFEEFRTRVDRCQAAMERAQDRTGRPAIYAPNLSPPIAELDRYAESLVRRGIQAVLVAPLLLGLDTVRRLTEQYPLFVMAHPTFTGCFFHDPDHGVDPGVLLGQWFRLIGCDATIFPNYGGRFSFSPEECRSIVSAARSPQDPIRSCWPTPAGGMSFERIPEMAADYGADSMLLIGGALLGDSQSLRESTSRFRERIADCFPEHRQTAPQTDTLASACELPRPAGPSERLLEHLAFQSGYQWDGRSATAYKQNGALPFAGVARTELIGTHGEKTAFDVRYFEIEPGGYSSHEKHAHTHVIIGLRGDGVLQLSDREITVRPNDIAYVPPLEPHQLRNASTEPFGFLCIVDHDRDKPQAP